MGGVRSCSELFTLLKEVAVICGWPNAHHHAAFASRGLELKMSTCSFLDSIKLFNFAKICTDLCRNAFGYSVICRAHKKRYTRNFLQALKR